MKTPLKFLFFIILSSATDWVFAQTDLSKIIDKKSNGDYSFNVLFPASAGRDASSMTESESTGFLQLYLMEKINQVDFKDLREYLSMNNYRFTVKLERGEDNTEYYAFYIYFKKNDNTYLYKRGDRTNMIYCYFDIKSDTTPKSYNGIIDYLTIYKEKLNKLYVKEKMYYQLDDINLKRTVLANSENAEVIIY